MSGTSAVLSRIAQLNSLIRTVDPSWQSAALAGGIVGGSQSQASFANAMQSASTSTGQMEVSLPSLSQLIAQFGGGSSISGDTVAIPSYGSSGSLASPSPVDPASMTWQSTDAALAKFDAVSSEIPYAAQIRSAAVANGIDPLLLASLVHAESGFRPDAVSRCGAQGLTQLMPKTAQGMGVTDSFDPQQNLDGGAHYIAIQLNRFGRVDLALAAYNAGPGTVSRLGAVPASKQGYVNVILNRWIKYQGDAA
jgi:hypothetical protein